MVEAVLCSFSISGNPIFGFGAGRGSEAHRQTWISTSRTTTLLPRISSSTGGSPGVVDPSSLGQHSGIIGELFTAKTCRFAHAQICRLRILCPTKYLQSWQCKGLMWALCGPHDPCVMPHNPLQCRLESLWSMAGTCGQVRKPSTDCEVRERWVWGLGDGALRVKFLEFSVWGLGLLASVGSM